MFRFVSFFSVIASIIGLSCLDDKGLTTDSWTIIKAPKTGDAFLYATGTEDFYQPSYSLNDTSQGALSLTLNQLWESETSYVLFNDEPPGVSGYNYTVGHTKGILAVDSEAQTGLYIVHSFPSWPLGPGGTKSPSIQNSYGGLSSNLWTYGQNAYCVSVSAKTIDTFAYSFQLNIPYIYDTKLSTTVMKSLPNVTALINGTVSKADICANHPFTTIGGKQHILFSKSTQWNKDLWFSCVAPYIKKDLVVESWIRGSAIGPSCSGTYEVNDASEISFDSSFTWSEYNDQRSAPSAGSPFHFLSEMDHSKWATSTDGQITCHGDINRMTTQYVRGGGAVCFISTGYDLEKSITKENSC
jgi:deoxyribonuclease-2